MTATTLKIKEAHSRDREAPRFITPKPIKSGDRWYFPRGYWSTTYRDFRKKPRLYVGIDGESMMENFAFRTSRPSLYKSIMPEMLAALGLPADTKATWNQRAGCSCGCSPGFVLDIPGEAINRMPVDFWVTVEATEDAQTTGTPEAFAVANDRVAQLAAQM